MIAQHLARVRAARAQGDKVDWSDAAWTNWASMCEEAHGAGATLEEIGKASGLTRERIRQVLVKRRRMFGQ